MNHPLEMQYYVNSEGAYLGGWDNNPPENAIAVASAPLDARQVWDGEKWGDIPPSQDDARQYLALTDWYVMRFLETGEPIPEDVKGKRAAARLTLSD